MNGNTTIMSVKKDTLFKNNKLFPIIKDVSNLKFVSGFEMIIDGSESYDEGLPGPEDEDLIFNWKCPKQFKFNCTMIHERILTLKSDDYTGIKSIVDEAYILDAPFELELKHHCCFVVRQLLRRDDLLEL